jgi:ferric-dicitrate binding protein FerR (iron transport regulator)
MSPEERAAFDRRRRARNIALMAALAGLVVLFYLISMARLTRA